LVNKFESTGSVNKKPVNVTRDLPRNIAAVRDSVFENPRQSIPHFRKMATWRIIRWDLGLHPYKIQLTQELRVNDYRQRRVFADSALQ